MDEQKKKKPGEEQEREAPESLNEELFGNDEIDIQIKEGEKLEFGFSFNAQDGESGDESDDFGDLPEPLKKTGHQYDPALASGEKSRRSDPNEISDSMHIADSFDAGISFDDVDRYETDAPDSEPTESN